MWLAVGGGGVAELEHTRRAISRVVGVRESRANMNYSGTAAGCVRDRNVFLASFPATQGREGSISAPILTQNPTARHTAREHVDVHSSSCPLDGRSLTNEIVSFKVYAYTIFNMITLRRDKCLRSTIWNESGGLSTHPLSLDSHRSTVYHDLSRRWRHPKPTPSRASLQLPEHHICSALFHTQASPKDVSTLRSRSC